LTEKTIRFKDFDNEALKDINFIAKKLGLVDGKGNANKSQTIRQALKRTRELIENNKKNSCKPLKS